MCLRVQVRAGEHVSVETSTFWDAIPPQVQFTLFAWRKVSHWPGTCLLVRLGQMASERQESYLCLPGGSAGITNMCHHAWLFDMGPSDQTQILLCLLAGTLLPELSSPVCWQKCLMIFFYLDGEYFKKMLKIFKCTTVISAVIGSWQHCFIFQAPLTFFLFCFFPPCEGNSKHFTSRSSSVNLWKEGSCVMMYYLLKLHKTIWFSQVSPQMITHCSWLIYLINL